MAGRCADSSGGATWENSTQASPRKARRADQWLDPSWRNSDRAAGDGCLNEVYCGFFRTRALGNRLDAIGCALNQLDQRCGYSWFRYLWVLLVFVGSVNHIGADCLHLLMIEDALERCHPVVLHRTVEHDLVKEIVAEEARCTKVRHDTAPHRTLAVAHAAKAPEQRSARGGRGRIRRVGGRIDHEGARLERRQRRGAAQLEHQNAAYVTQV